MRVHKAVVYLSYLPHRGYLYIAKEEEEVEKIMKKKFITIELGVPALLGIM